MGDPISLVVIEGQANGAEPEMQSSFISMLVREDESKDGNGPRSSLTGPSEVSSTERERQKVEVRLGSPTEKNQPSTPDNISEGKERHFSASLCDADVQKKSI